MRFLPFLVYALVAWFSLGYHHPDEHFQILEPAMVKLGRAPASDLAWEFEAQIRPGLQPWVATKFIQGAEALHIRSPFTQAFLLRLLIGWATLLLWQSYATAFFTQAAERRIFGLLLFLLWLAPYFNVRFSSENAAALAFWGGVLLLLEGAKAGQTKHWKILAAGLALALSFYLRFQMGFALLGLGLWLLLVAKSKLRTWLLLLAGGMAGLALGAVADCWLYGQWVLTPLNYFTVNILENKAVAWGTEPWWYYGSASLLEWAPPVSVLIWAAALAAMYRMPKRVELWCFIPFFLAHSVVAHKELRFLLPMLLPLLLFAVSGWVQVLSVLKNIFLKKTLRVLWVLALGINFILLPLRSILPAKDSVAYYRYMYKERKYISSSCSNPEATTLWVPMDFEFYKMVGLKANFYRTDRVVTRAYDGEGPVRISQCDYVLTLRPNQPEWAGLPTLRREYCLLPEFLLKFNVNNWQNRSNIWTIWKL